MKDPSGTTRELIEEIASLKERIRELERLEGRRTEEALRESERKFRDLAEKSIAGIYVLRPDGVVRYVNARCAEIFG
ncbi:MAG TPA: PAS domain-containing protein, partial [Syntrophorhabdaceae bacterium]|nr:PAS domain-containing protein [Syntrophorhabdaceae bacterium]